MGINGSKDQYAVRNNCGGCAIFFFISRLKTFPAAICASAGVNLVISFLDDLHKGKKGLPMVFRGDGAHMNGMVGGVVVELSEICHGGLLSNFAKILEPGFETVGLGEGGTNYVGVRIMKHCHAQDMHVRIRVNRGWVIVVVARANHDMHSAILISPFVI